MATPTPADDLFLALQAALAGEYSLVRELGRGGMGIVYLAQEVRLAREVAIKVLPPAMARSVELREQFLREAQTAARLSHPNIVPIFRVGEAGDFVYFAMAYVNGQTLAQQIATHGPVAPHRASRMLRDVAWALTYAHTSGTIHRDVKADNILLEAGSGRALVTDFGLANPVPLDRPGQITGSVHYLSPEQIAGQPVDARSDVYSLGVVGYLALTGRLPFDAPTTSEVLTMHLREPHRSIVSIAPTVPGALAQVVERCLAKDPARRYPAASAFAEALDGSVEPVTEIPAPIRVWITKGERGRGTTIFVSLYLGMALGGVAFTTATHAGVSTLAAFFLSSVSPLTMLGLLVALPSILSTRRALRAGYGLHDLRGGLRQHWLKRREELVYEMQASPFRTPLRIAAVVILSLGSISYLAFSNGLPLLGGAAAARGIALTVLGTAAAGIGAVGVAGLWRRRRAKALTSFRMWRWGGKLGEFITRIARIGLKPTTAAQFLPQRTEMTLGRATDALYQALPRATRRQLQGLPATVQRLESDAGVLREQVGQLNASIAAIASDHRPASGGPGQSGPYDALHAELVELRDRAQTHLASTVAALENIRLGLLRLQLGAGRIESITATLDAASGTAADVSALVEAHSVLAHELRPAR